MKKTLPFFAPLAAILLLSCSSIEDSNLSSQDVNLPQANALAKPATSAEILDKDYVDPGVGTRATGSQKVNSGKTMSVAAVPVGAFACSNEIDYYFGNPPTTATITRLEASGGTVASNAGAFTMSYLRVRCGTSMTYATMPWNGSTPINPSTTYTTGLNGQPAKTTCWLSFCGTCAGGYYPVLGGPYVAQCNKSYSNVSLTNYYQY